MRVDLTILVEWQLTLCSTDDDVDSPIVEPDLFRSDRADAIQDHLPGQIAYQRKSIDHMRKLTRVSGLTSLTVSAIILGSESTPVEVSTVSKGRNQHG